MAIDDTRLRDLLEQSHDLHSDAMSTTAFGARRIRRARARRPVARRRRTPSRLDGRDACSRGLPKSGVLAGAGLGTAMAALIASPAFADKTMDVQMLQTAASIENLAVATYDTALTLDFIGGGSANGVVKAFVEKTKEQHQQHAEAFNAAATRLGRQGAGPARPRAPRRREQRQADAHRTRRRSSTSRIELEDGAAQTYVANIGAYSNKNAPVGDRQHHGRRGAARRDPQRGEGARSPAGAADLIALPPDAADVAGRRRQRRLPRRVLPDRPMPVPRPKEQCSEAPQAARTKDGRHRARARALTDDLDDAHHESLPSMRDSLADVAATPTRRHPRGHHASSCPRRPSRRLFLLGGGALARRRRARAAAAPAAASRPPPRARSSGVLAGRWPRGVGAEAHRRPRGRRRSPRRSRTSRSAPTRPGSTPRPRASSARCRRRWSTFATTAQAQHKDHAAAWNGVLTGAGKKAVTGVDLTVKKSRRQGVRPGHRRRPGSPCSRSTSRTSPRPRTSRRSTA